MATEIILDADLIRQHASRVGQAGDAVRLAENAASSMNLGGGAFGVLCSFLVTPATLVSSVAASTISSAAELIERAERELKGLADDVDALEDEHLQTIAGVQSILDAAAQ